MKRIKVYSYTILLIISIFVASPLILRKIWISSKPEEPASSDAGISYESREEPQTTAEITSEVTTAADVTETGQVSQTEASAATTAVSTTTQEVTEPAKQFTESDASYFDDALFIGDSRTLGLYEYGTLKNADYFCTQGMNVYDLPKESVTVGDLGNITLEKLFSEKSYGKIYIMLGLNELGYEFNRTVDQYRQCLDLVREKQPDAIIYIEANLHVTTERSSTDSIFNNQNINRFNKAISEMADGEKTFYIDVNEYFDDDKGNLPSGLSSDHTHVYAKYYPEWCDWLCTKTIPVEDPAEPQT